VKLLRSCTFSCSQAMQYRLWTYSLQWCYFAHYYLSRGGYDIPGVCLSVCLSECLFALQLHEKLLIGYLLKFLSQTCRWTRKNSLNFGSHLRFDHEIRKLKNFNFATHCLFTIENCHIHLPLPISHFPLFKLVPELFRNSPFHNK